MMLAVESTPPRGTRTSHQWARIIADEFPVRGSYVAFLDLAGGVEHADDVHVARVRVAGQRHRLVLKKHFQPRVRLVGARTIDALKIGDPNVLEVGQPDLISCRWVKPIEYGGISNLFPAGHLASATDLDGFAFVRPIDDRSVVGPAILFREFQRLRQFIRAPAQHNGYSAIGEAPGSLDTANLIPRPFECGHRSVLRAGIVIVA
jgi:hypothetical protein